MTHKRKRCKQYWIKRIVSCRFERVESRKSFSRWVYGYTVEVEELK